MEVAQSISLNEEQCAKLRNTLLSEVTIYSMAISQMNLPPLRIQPYRFLLGLCTALARAGVPTHDVRLEGSGATHCVARDLYPYNDLDLVFHLDSEDPGVLYRIREVILSHLRDYFVMHTGYRKTKAADVAPYLSKIFFSPDSATKFALFTLPGFTPTNSPSIDLKFVQHMKHPYQFSVNSLQIILPYKQTEMKHATRKKDKRAKCDSERAQQQVDASSTLPKDSSDATSDTKKLVAYTGFSFSERQGIQCIATYGHIADVIDHINSKIIAVKDEEDVLQLYGGCLLRFALLKSRGFVVAEGLDESKLVACMIERYLRDYPLPANPPPPCPQTPQHHNGGSPVRRQWPNHSRIFDYMSTHMRCVVPQQRAFLAHLRAIVSDWTATTKEGEQFPNLYASIDDLIALFEDNLQAIAYQWQVLSTQRQRCAPPALQYHCPPHSQHPPLPPHRFMPAFSAPQPAPVPPNGLLPAPQLPPLPQPHTRQGSISPPFIASFTPNSARSLSPAQFHAAKVAEGAADKAPQVVPTMPQSNAPASDPQEVPRRGHTREASYASIVSIGRQVSSRDESDAESDETRSTTCEDQEGSDSEADGDGCDNTRNSRAGRQQGSTGSKASLGAAPLVIDQGVSSALSSVVSSMSPSQHDSPKEGLSPASSPATKPANPASLPVHSLYPDASQQPHHRSAQSTVVPQPFVTAAYSAHYVPGFFSARGPHGMSNTVPLREWDPTPPHHRLAPRVANATTSGYDSGSDSQSECVHGSVHGEAMVAASDSSRRNKNSLTCDASASSSNRRRGRRAKSSGQAKKRHPSDAQELAPFVHPDAWEQSRASETNHKSQSQSQLQSSAGTQRGLRRKMGRKKAQDSSPQTLHATADARHESRRQHQQHGQFIDAECALHDKTNYALATAS